MTATTTYNTKTTREIVEELMSSSLEIHETYNKHGWTKGMINTQIIHINQWDNKSRWDEKLNAVDNLFRCKKEDVYEAFSEFLARVVGNIEDPHDIHVRVNTNCSVIQIAVRYRYSWL